MKPDLLKQHCVPCEGGVPTLTSDEIKSLHLQIPEWILSEDEKKIIRTFTFPNFVDAMRFANLITDLAEQENHHPDLHIAYGKVTVELWTHAIGGLSDNDFILAAKIDHLLPS